jgi:hypothetical protein
MKTLTNWWSTKSDHKRQNWMMLSLGMLFLATGFVEALPYIAGLCAIPVLVLIYIEVRRP